MEKSLTRNLGEKDLDHQQYINFVSFPFVHAFYSLLTKEEIRRKVKEKKLEIGHPTPKFLSGLS